MHETFAAAHGASPASSPRHTPDSPDWTAEAVSAPCSIYVIKLYVFQLESDLLRKYRIQISGNSYLILKAFYLLLLFGS